MYGIIRWVWSTAILMKKLKRDFLSLLRENSCTAQQKVTLFMVHAFFKKQVLEKFGNFWFSGTGGCHGACVDKAQKAKGSSQKMRFVHSYTRHRVKSGFYSTQNPSQVRATALESLKFDLYNRDGS
jgi:hypothetical protein